MLHKRWIALVFLASHALAASAQTPSPPLDGQDELDKPATLTLTQKFMGVDITMPVAMDLHASTAGGGLKLDVDMDADLASLQQNAGRLVQSLDILPSDNCKKYANNAVIKAESVELYVEGSEVVAKVKGNADIWNCQKGAPSITVQWKNKCWRVFGKKMCTKVPASARTHHGSDIKAKLIDADFTAFVPFTLGVLEGGTSVEVRPGKTRVIVPNTIVDFLDDIASMFDTGANDVLQKQISSAVSGGDLRLVLPENISAYKPRIEVATFYKTDRGTIGLKTSFGASLSDAQVNELLSKLLVASN